MSRRSVLLVVLTAAAMVVGWATPALADNCGTPADCFGVAGSFGAASNGMLALVGLSLLLDFIPVVGTGKGIIEAFTGKDLITGEELAWWERALGAVPVVGRLSAIGGVTRAVDAAGDASRAADAAGDASRAADAAGDASRAADEVDDASDAARAADGGGGGGRGGDGGRGGTGGGGRGGDDGGGGGGPPGPRDPHDFNVDPPESMTPDEWFDELARDPATGNRITPQGLAEREVGLALQERGDLPGPIRRDPTGGSEFVDATGQSWDVKAFHSEFPNGFNPTRIETDMRIAFDPRVGERYIVDTRYMSGDDIRALRGIVDGNGWSDFVRWYP